MSHPATYSTPLSSLMHTPIRGTDGRTVGRVCECIVYPAKAPNLVTHIALAAPRSLTDKQIRAVDVSGLYWKDGRLSLKPNAVVTSIELPDDVVFLEKDLLDQQIIDVHGFKVVRVNDVDLVWDTTNGTQILRIAEVEVGLRGGVRRLLKGLPQQMVETFSRQFQARIIPWEFVDLIDRDPSRRVRLKVEQHRLAHMHPSDIADILEELAPAERDAVFRSLNEELAAEALEEVEPKLQKALLESIDSDRAAEIVGEMDPGAAADLLAELSDERSEAILEEMEPEERQEVEELLEYPEDWAAGSMTTDFVHIPVGSTVMDVIAALRNFEGDTETITEVYLTDEEERLKGNVPVARLLLAERDAPIAPMADARNVHCALNASSKHVAELFDKYNLYSLPVVEEDGKLAGVIHAEHVIALLRAEK